MSSPSDQVELEPEWWALIDKKAALREQFPPLSKVRHERPGCAVDVERKRQFREAAELKKAREQEARWRAACEENERRRQRADNQRRAAEYRTYQQDKTERKTA